MKQLKNKEYAQRLKEMEGYEREIIAFRLCDEVPDYAEPYGEDVSFLCAITAEVLEGKKPIYITNKNIICGGGLYAGIGMKKMSKEEFDEGMVTVFGKGASYATRKQMRRANQQITHHFKQYKYFVIGALDEIEDPHLVMIIADVPKVMRLCKAYNWDTGELIHGFHGNTWCGQSLTNVYKDKSMTFNMGDRASRLFMKLKPEELYCIIHYEILPRILENMPNIASGEVF
jgi:uncharacterized protein (DUF169 family)